MPIESEKILQIYTIFYRDSLYGGININEVLVHKTTCISKDFSVELFRKEDCPYKKEHCFGINRKIK